MLNGPLTLAFAAVEGALARSTFAVLAAFAPRSNENLTARLLAAPIRRNKGGRAPAQLAVQRKRAPDGPAGKETCIFGSSSRRLSRERPWPPRAGS